MSRKKRPGEVVCRCGAYRFPHRFMGGACNGGAFVQRTWESNYGGGSCRGCPNASLGGDSESAAIKVGLHCQALEGIEALRTCQELDEHIRHHGVKLYGVNKPPAKKMGWRR